MNLVLSIKNKVGSHYKWMGSLMLSCPNACYPVVDLLMFNWHGKHMHLEIYKYIYIICRYIDIYIKYIYDPYIFFYYSLYFILSQSQSEKSSSLDIDPIIFVHDENWNTAIL